jgi:hypothetical protein
MALVSSDEHRAWKLQRPEGNAIAYVRLRDFFSMIIAATVQFVRQSAFVRQRFAAEIGWWTRPPCPPASQASRSARPTGKSGRLSNCGVSRCPGENIPLNTSGKSDALSRVSRPNEGRWPTSSTRHGMRWTRRRDLTKRADADGEVVWS